MKKTTLFRIILLMIFFIAHNHAFSQSYGKHLDLLSPTTADFMRFGNLPVSHYTGQANINVPLYEYKDPDFTIPLSVQYSSQGCIPSKRPGVVGLDWHLVAGGSITREVNGLPDDFINPDHAFIMLKPEFEYGFWVGTRDYTKYNQNQIFELQNGIGRGFQCFNDQEPGGVVYSQCYWDLGYDYEPDIFHFSFLGYQGYFLFNNDGTIKVCSPSDIKVDFSEFMSQHTSSLKITTPSVIKLTTPDGYVYHFGGDASCIESSRPLTPNYEVYKETALAWHLSKIVAPNGREVKFHYLPFTETTPQKSVSYYLTSYFNQIISQYYSYNYSNDSNTAEDLKNITKVVYLDSIRIGSTLIVFKKSPEEVQFYQNENYENNTLQLDSIKVFHDKNIRFEAGLKYEVISRRRFLSEIKKSGENSHLFTYRSAGQLPSANSKAIDHWGFYRGVQTALIPSQKWDWDFGNVEITSNARDAVWPYPSYGMLEKIQYPTGGYSIIDYEPHEYGKRLNRKHTSTFYPAFEYVTGQAGGCRVKKITDYNSDNSKSDSKTYYYTRDYSPGSTLIYSGILLDYPRYIHFQKHFLAGYNTTQMLVEVRSSSFSKNYNANEPFICYCEVAEVLEDKSCTIYKFTSYESNPDINDDNHRKILPEDRYTGIKPSLDTYYLYLKMKELNSCREERGKLACLIQINANQDIMQQVVNTYSKINTGSYVVGMRSCNVAFAYKIYTTPSLLLNSKTTNYDSNGSNPVTTETVYKYKDNSSLLEKMTTSTSTNDNVSTVYKYPVDFKSSYPYNEMVTRNIISPVVEKSEFKNNTLLNTELTEYSSPYANLYLPARSMFQVGYNALEERATYLYDSKGNTREVMKDQGADKTVYLWGYNYQYPIAEIKGVSYEEVKAAIAGNEATINTLGASLMPDMTKVDALRSSMPRALVTTYTYKPLVGISLKTDPRGVKTLYDYDTFGRLIQVKLNDKVIQQYQYNYKNN